MSIKSKHTFFINEDGDTDLGEIFEGIVNDTKKNLLPGDYAVYVCDRKKHRSISQRRYLMGVVYKMISKEIGHAINELHEYFKEKFLPIKIIEVLGDSVESISTNNVTSKEMGDYIEEIIDWADVKINVNIPTRDELAQPIPPKSNIQDIIIDEYNDHWKPKKDRKK